jgi:hypothetical protein
LVDRLGLTVLLRQGLAAWIEQWSKTPVPMPAPSTEPSRSMRLPDGCNTDIINVLAAMALSHVKEVPV